MGRANNDNQKKLKTRITPHVQPMLSSEEILSLSIEDLLSRLNSSTTGLSSQEAEKRLVVYGRNELARGHKHSALREFLLHFKSPLVIILMVAGVISGILGEYAHCNNYLYHSFCKRISWLITRKTKPRKPLNC